MSLNVQDIDGLMQRHGSSLYGGEAVSQLEHALQAAALAERAGENDATVVAALLHDLGHLINADRPVNPELTETVDGLHEYVVVPFLRGTFDDAVIEPIRMHVEAKRYLCLIEPSYWDSLSPASKHSLALQGGVFDEAAAEAFFNQPFAPEAIRLRRYDDLAKVVGEATPPWSHYLALMQALSASTIAPPR